MILTIKQQPHMEPILLLPNDTLILECYYQTLDSNHTITSGMSTGNEMCLVFIYVYPSINLATCDSTHLYSDFLEWAAIAYKRRYLTNLDTLYYDINVPGALEWYEVLWNNYTAREQTCNGQNATSLLEDINVVFMKRDEYIPYNDSTPCIQSDYHTSNAHNSYHYFLHVVIFINIVCVVFYL